MRKDALAVAVDTPTLVAERLATPTRHVVAAFRAFDPEIAVRTLLELFTLSEVVKGCIQLLSIVGELVVFAGLALMVFHFTDQTVVVLAKWTLQLIAICTLSPWMGLSTLTLLCRVVNESKLAVCCRTPGQIFVGVHHCIEGKG